jgi:hypothetical protein
LTSKGRQPKNRPRAVALAEVTDDLSKYLRLAAEEEIVVTRHGPTCGQGAKPWTPCSLSDISGARAANTTDARGRFDDESR